MGNTFGDPSKVRLEQLVAEGFLLEYNLAMGGAFQVLHSGGPPEPDVMCKDTRTGERIGIEVGVAYYGSEHAKSVWQEARGRKATPYLLNKPDRSRRTKESYLKLKRSSGRKARSRIT